MKNHYCEPIRLDLFWAGIALGPPTKDGGLRSKEALLNVIARRNQLAGDDEAISFLPVRRLPHYASLRSPRKELGSKPMTYKTDSFYLNCDWNVGTLRVISNMINFAGVPSNL